MAHDINFRYLKPSFQMLDELIRVGEILLFGQTFGWCGKGERFSGGPLVPVDNNKFLFYISVNLSGHETMRRTRASMDIQNDRISFALPANKNPLRHTSQRHFFHTFNSL